MSGRLVGACLREARTTMPTAKLVLCCIAEHSRDGGLGAALNYPTIARETCLSTRQVIRLVAHLVAVGDLSVLTNKGRTNVYMVDPWDE